VINEQKIMPWSDFGHCSVCVNSQFDERSGCRWHVIKASQTTPLAYSPIYIEKQAEDEGDMFR